MMTLLSRIKYVNEATITKPHMNFWFEDSKLYIYNKTTPMNMIDYHTLDLLAYKAWLIVCRMYLCLCVYLLWYIPVSESQKGKNLLQRYSFAISVHV